MRRRKFIAGLVSTVAAQPLVSRAQRPALPMIGLLDSRPADAVRERLRAYRQGLKETGYVEGENVAIVYRFAENRIERLPELVADLVRRPVALIATAGDDVALVAKAATKTIPLVFVVSHDPASLGLVDSVARPGGNATGINFLTGEVAAKRLELLHELVPAATRIAVLVNPSNPVTERTLRELRSAVPALGLQIQVVNAGTRQEIDAAFATFAHERSEALFVSPDPFFSSRRAQIVNLASRYAIPATMSGRDTAEMGGLMHYGADILDAWRQSGAYCGRILKGAKPADLPVVQSSKFELVINHQTARMLGITVSDKLLALADEVIE
jgi:putative ABC transport system substrate-binding protein